MMKQLKRVIRQFFRIVQQQELDEEKDNFLYKFRELIKQEIVKLNKQLSKKNALLLIKISNKTKSNQEREFKGIHDVIKNVYKHT
ncbi:unnamed protein product [Paramecium sonneborni]|uniref:Uncharacterized protein n=1 Tax=Paramecium sonneborni TaxID=65129 RepID=A0A8S1P7F0_9CILI|nr:unnamed protein product [Paramecium sonneborni]